MIKQQVIAACRRMLGPIIRILIRNGVSWREFSELGKEVYVEIARRDYGVQGRPTNVARVAMMTGLSRREVTRIRDVIEGEIAEPAEDSNRISTVLSGWYLDPEFHDANGNPATLSESGEPSIKSLLARYAGDLPHGAFIKELLQLGLVARGEAGYSVRSRTYVRRAADPDLLNQAATALQDHGATLAFNVDSERAGAPRFERMATSRQLDRQHLDAFYVVVEERGAAFLEDIDAWLAVHSVQGSEDQGKTVRAGLGMYLIQDED